MLARLGVLVDTWDGGRKADAFRKGWPAASRPGIKFHRTGRVQFRYREAGAGPTIVFTADPPVTIEAYDEVLGVFSPHFRTIVVELPAMGFSAAGPGFGFGFKESNDELAAFLSDIAGPNAVLAFSCVASLAAVDIARRRPDLVRALTLLQATDWAGFQNWKRARDPKGVLGKPVIGQIVMRKLARERAPAWFKLAVGAEDRRAGMCDCAMEGLAAGAGWTLASAYQRYLDEAREPRLDIEQPLLVIWGCRDGSHRHQAGRRARAFSARAHLVELDSVGHFPELEAPQAVLAAITRFLETDAMTAA